MISEISPGRVLDTVVVENQIAIVANTNNQKILSYQTRFGSDVYLAFVGDAWDSVLDTKITNRVLVDGCQLWNFQDSKVQRAAPETSGYNELSPWIKINEGGTIRYEVDNTTASTGNVTARFKIKYVEKKGVK